ncbi:hypothetical protein A3A76_05785 [Candidatus Woesebacteria bacterium RIFCSPLOWO2_01_FULL_39_23]|uniref:HTH cro/C1-type domain-containing protein n=1 Tax=Candidatus Woesebacteria bacterium RIFCSPHIGHO2_01_FULL_40_22 TaxID=1802499 RepID=A0A1F7YHT6_9BACT|nr:MAG: hypothetical protein A2141_02480 [Candidatus Woesebacteria bacterium RBG_16_40_11]OGM26911.1 MAG: hypothetical protein A2628_05725 [Candidatus Woesebacteria bacterium RIFCSPHIGHO2_01_FULL_40_22]OGM38460.1 MAG: hypothetical protein A3E41_01335 [Candidatus Woesebacteria bacterium RIFCSPHIGHO2_12_FULL_38_9]OGM63186.1 MAG: hypothetical protein A3A76_05785 [Candidatus Woesebacteria bacterium RIFCSPLOWO2_01_FULL_39_23]
MKEQSFFYTREEAEKIVDQQTLNFLRNLRLGLIQNGFNCVPGMCPERVSGIYNNPMNIRLDEISRVAKALGMTVREIFGVRVSTKDRQDNT